MYRIILVCVLLLSMETRMLDAENTSTEKTWTAVTLQLGKGVSTKQLSVTATPKVTFTFNEDRNISATPNEPYTFKTIEDLCRILDVNEDECTCSMFTLEGDGLIESLCKHLKDGEENVPRTLSYDAKLSRSYATVSVLFCIIGIIGNAAVIMATYNKRKTISQYRLLITELAVSDFVFAFFQLFSSVPTFWTNKWIYNEAWCKVSSSGQLLGALYSIGFILIIAIERFYGTLYGMKRFSNSRKLMHILTAINIVSGFASVVPLFVVVGINDLGKCSEIWPNGIHDSLIYNLFLTICHFAIPIIVVCVLYVRMMTYLCKNAKKSIALQNRQAKQRNDRNKRTVLILIAILIAFIISVLPNRIVSIYLDVIKFKLDRDVFMILSFIAYVPYQFHLAINPIVYTAIDKKWRKEMWAVFTCNPKTKNNDCSDTRSRSSTLSLLKSISCTTVNKQTWLKDKKGRNVSMDMVMHLVSSSSSPVSSPVSLRAGNDDVFVNT